MVTMKECHKCLDWWSPPRDNVHENVKKYPVTPQALAEKEETPTVELSFELMENSIVDVFK